MLSWLLASTELRTIVRKAVFPPLPFALLLNNPRRRDGRVAEGARLESVYTGNRIVGSNPTPSASPVPILKPISVDDSPPYVAMRGEGSTQY